MILRAQTKFFCAYVCYVCIYNKLFINNNINDAVLIHEAIVIVLSPSLS